MSIVGHIVWWLKYSLAFLAKVAQVHFSIYRRVGCLTTELTTEMTTELTTDLTTKLTTEPDFCAK